MYDITNEESFNSVQDWYETNCLTYFQQYLLVVVFRVTQIKTYSWDNAQVILVGNKCDMEDERVISFERGKQLAEQLGVEFFETSAKENINVKVSCPSYVTQTETNTFLNIQAVFERLVDIICDKMSDSLDTDPTLMSGGAKGQRLTDQPQGPQAANCNC